MIKRKSRGSATINASTMADIAFLLLVFFLMVTTIATDKGLPILLPPKKDPNEPPPDFLIKQRNIWKVLINSKDMLLVEEERMDVSLLKEKTKEFLANRGRNSQLSDSPQKAVVSIKADRGTSYEMYIYVIDEIKTAYHELRAEFLGITVEKYLRLNKKNKGEKAMYNKARREYPLQISEAEPTDYGI